MQHSLLPRHEWVILLQQLGIYAPKDESAQRKLSQHAYSAMKENKIHDAETVRMTDCLRVFVLSPLIRIVCLSLFDSNFSTAR